MRFPFVDCYIVQVFLAVQIGDIDASAGSEDGKYRALVLGLSLPTCRSVQNYSSPLYLEPIKGTVSLELSVSYIDLLAIREEVQTSRCEVVSNLFASVVTIRFLKHIYMKKKTEGNSTSIGNIEGSE